LLPDSRDDVHLRRSDRLRQLLDVGRSLTAELDLDVLLERVLQTARSTTSAASSRSF